MLTVALVGADGAGKSTVAHRLAESLDLPVRYLYMGVNLEASRLMLPTTRLALAIKRRSGHRADMTATPVGLRPRQRTRWNPVGAARSGLRTANWMAEELFREAVGRYHRRRGRVVLYDRLFLADYYERDVKQADPTRPLASRIHGWFLRHVTRVPDLVVVLDAPGEVLYARKPESSVEFLESRRQEYLALRGVVPRLVVVDATQPLDAVLDAVSSLIMEAWQRTQQRAQRGGTEGPSKGS